jgi:lipid II:glycine glycyltransferase (peptidoglycan interpeptide bridge formation enzyme)
MPYVTQIDLEKVQHDPNLFQSAFWAHFKENRGYDIQAFHIHCNGTKTPMIMVHRPCAVDSMYGYVPHGPDVSIPQDQQGRLLEYISENIRHCLPSQCRFLRYDLPWPNPYADADPHGPGWSGPPEPRIRELRMNFGTRSWNLRKAPTDMHPPDTVVLDLRKPTPRIFRNMHKKTRYGIRSAFRQGIAVERKGREQLPLWHRLYLEMAERKGIVAEGLDYFRELFKAARNHKPDLQFYLGFRNGELVAGSIIAHHRSTAYYLHSASSPVGRKFMASYAVLWKAMTDAKARGCRFFDLFGIPPTGDPTNPMHGLYQFKTRFGGEIRHLRGCWDYPFDDEQYSLLAFAAGTLNPYHRC